MKHETRKALGKLACGAVLALLAGAAMAQSASADGEIRKLDAAASRVVIKHGEWKGMNMGAMTMAFKVRSASLLDGLKVADKVRFSIEKEGADFVVTAISPATQASPHVLAATHISGDKK